MRSTTIHDVFLCHNSADKPLVRYLAFELQAAGLSVFLDEAGLRPGVPWQDKLVAAIKTCSATVVVIGTSVGPWQREEVRLALEEQIQRGCPVVPLILPGVEEVPSHLDFLKQRTWVDCREQQISKHSIDKLIWGITGIKPMKMHEQLEEEFSLKLPSPVGGDRIIRIATLPNPSQSNLLNLTWNTFGQGIERLREQIQNYGSGLGIDACFGINDAGLIMATFLNASACGRVKLGYVKCKGPAEGKTISDDSFFPNLQPTPRILLADFEVKTSNDLKVVVEKLRQEYQEPILYFAVFGAMTNVPDLKLNGFEDLVSASNLSSLGIRDYFIACTMHSPGIEPPLGLR